MEEKVKVHAPADLKDLGLSPYYGWLVEILTEHIHPDTSAGETPEVPLYEGPVVLVRPQKSTTGQARTRKRFFVLTSTMSSPTLKSGNNRSTTSLTNI
jgi:hypothetical protein